METAPAAERHGWTEVRVHGDQFYKDAAAMAALLRGITVLNHELSPEAQAQFDRLLAERAAHAEGPREPRNVTKFGHPSRKPLSFDDESRNSPEESRNGLS